MKQNISLIIFLASFLTGYILISNLFKSDNSNRIIYQSLTTKITLAFVGDLMCHTPQIKASKDSSGLLNFNPTFEFVKDIISSADVAFGNLETTIGDSNDTYTGYPRFRSPAEFLEGLKAAGFDFLFIANNHILDFGENGIIKTTNFLKLKNFGYTGAFANYNDYDSTRILSVNNIKLGLIAATFSTNGIYLPTDKNYLVNLINLDSLKNQIKKLRNSGAELIVINLHFGDEYSNIPNNYQKLVVDSLLNFGADLIVGNHSHVLQPIEIRKSNNSKIDSVLIAYSLGNFISNQRKLETATGVILFIQIEKDLQLGKIQLKKIKLLPTYVFKGKIEGKTQSRILPLSNEKIFSDSVKFPFSEQSVLRKSFELSRKILLKYVEGSKLIQIL